MCSRSQRSNRRSAAYRVRGSRNAGCPAPAARVRKNAHGRHHRYPGTPGASCAMVLTAYAALSLATNSSCHHRRRIERRSCPVGRSRLRRLSISNGCQDHTVLPSQRPYHLFDRPCAADRILGEGVEAPFVCAKAGRSQRKPCPATAYTPALPRPPHPIPRRDDLRSALCGVGWILSASHSDAADKPTPNTFMMTLIGCAFFGTAPISA